MSWKGRVMPILCTHDAQPTKAICPLANPTSTSEYVSHRRKAREDQTQLGLDLYFQQLISTHSPFTRPHTLRCLVCIVKREIDLRMCSLFCLFESFPQLLWRHCTPTSINARCQEADRGSDCEEQVDRVGGIHRSRSQGLSNQYHTLVYER